MSRNREFLEQHAFDQDKDYSADFAGLFGADVNPNSALYYRGPGSRWRYALQDRMDLRSMQRYGLAESAYENAQATMDAGNRALMYRRNNAIEDMFRKGYSLEQLNAHLDGQRNVLAEGPDYKEYQTGRGQGFFANDKWTRGTFNDYFKFIPEGISNTESPSMPTVADVQNLYRQYLGREGAEEYVQRWVDTGMSLSDIERGIAESPEALQYAQNNIGVTTNVDAATNAINLLFQQYGGRTPTQAELDQFLGVYGQTGAMNMASQIQGYFASGDPTGSQMNPVTAEQVQGLYQELLGRAGADQYVTEFINSGMTLDEIRNTMMQSQEYQDRQAILSGTGVTTNVDAATNAINLMFQQYGGRLPTQAELDQFLGVYGQVGAMDMANQIQSYFGTGTGTFTDDPTGSQMNPVTTGQVNQLYMELLGRPGAEQYLSGWVDSGMTLDQIRQEIMKSPEYQALQGGTGTPPEAGVVTPDQVQGLYQELLGRAGADEYIMQWINSGLSLDQIRQQIMESPEYQALQGGTGTPPGGTPPGGTPPGGTPPGGTPPGGQNPYAQQFEAMQTELAALREMLANMSSINQPTTGTATGTATSAGGAVEGGVYGSGGAYDPQQAFNPYRQPVMSTNQYDVPPTPEMFDAYRYQQLQSTAPSLVPTRVNEGPVSGYFGYNPRDVQAILSGF